MEVDENIQNNNFKDYNLKLELLRGLYSLGLEEPSNLQKKVFSILFSSSKDILVQSPKLTGKKLSIIIYSLQKVSKEKKETTQCLILCHTREAVTKIKNIYKEIAKFMNIKIHSLLGGTIKEDIKEISGGAEIVIGTPGRVLDLVNKKILNLNELEFFAIDDVKQMIERGFIETISNILNIANNKCRKAIFMKNGEYNKNEENEVNVILNLNDDVKNKLKIGKDIIMINNIIDNKSKLMNYRIFKLNLKENMKFNILLNIYKVIDISQSFIFCNELQVMNDLNKNLSDLNFACNSLNEDKSKNFSYLKKGQIRIITSTFDDNFEDFNIFNNVMIINYQMPKDIETFLKSFGKNDFFSKEGVIINFVTEDDKDLITSLEKLIEYPIQDLPKEFSENI